MWPVHHCDGIVLDIGELKDQTRMVLLAIVPGLPKTGSTRTSDWLFSDLPSGVMQMGNQKLTLHKSRWLHVRV